MAIVRNSFRVSRMDGDLSPGSRGAASSAEADEEDELRTVSEGEESEVSEASERSDSGMGSDEFDLSELCEAGTELCQVGNQSCALPPELYDLPGLGAVLSLETWNECLSEEERLALAELLPDLDQETFGQTLKELFTGKNFHFGSPMSVLFDQLKGGLCDPRTVLYRQGLNFFQRRRHYHYLCRYHNSMVGSLIQIRDAWRNCKAYGVDERLRLLNIVRNQRSLDYKGGDAESETDSESRGSGDQFWQKHFKMDRLRTSHDALAPKKLKLGKEKLNGVLKVSAPKTLSRKEYMGTADRGVSAIKHDVEAKTRAAGPLLGCPRPEKAAGYDPGATQRPRNQTSFDGDDLNEQMASEGMLKLGKAKESRKRYDRGLFRNDYLEGHGGPSTHYGKNTVTDQAVTVASYNTQYFDTTKKANKLGSEWMHPSRRPQHQVAKGNPMNWSSGRHPVRHNKMLEAAVSLDRSGKVEDDNVKGKIQKATDDNTSVKTKVVSHESKVKPYRSIEAQFDDASIQSDYRGKMSEGSVRGKVARDGALGMEHSKEATMFAYNEETESDSSGQIEDGGVINPFIRKTEFHKPAVPMPSFDSRKANKFIRKDNTEYSGTAADLGSYETKEKKKGKTRKPNLLQDEPLMKKNYLPETKENSQRPLMKNHNVERKQKGFVHPDEFSHPDQFSQHANHDQDFDSTVLNDSKRSLDRTLKLLDSERLARTQISDVQNCEASLFVKPSMPIIACDTAMKKTKAEASTMHLDELVESFDVQSGSHLLLNDSSITKKKGKRKADAEPDSITVVVPRPIRPEKDAIGVEPEKPQKKPYVLITPTIHTGFSFSIIHLLSAVRKGMITPTEDSTVIGNHLDRDDGRAKSNKEEQNHMPHVVNGMHVSESHEKMNLDTSEHASNNNLPSLTVQEILNRVRSNPGDPCILETQEPLQDLVRGVLKIFSSRTAPLGVKGWKALVSYEKSSKSWLWVGPLVFVSSDIDNPEEETSSEAWGIPHKMLVKLVDAFANWLKSSQETLQQIGSLPAPPVSMLSNLDERERFKDLRAQKSLNTISPSSEEVRAYFRREEVLRYSIPDRAFLYTAADGKKSIVAPLRRGGGKPTSKARDHFMLKPDRPPHVTILCLVRDAAARLPGSIGTRADVCRLLRDSQYIVEDISDAQVNQVVSGALDRLHYERDPCVQFDADRKLWVYLHRDREEEDFEDDGTSSTKKWKRQRKDGMDPSDTGAGGSAGQDYGPDLNIDSSIVKEEEKTELIYSDMRPDTGDMRPFIDMAPVQRSLGDSARWGTLQLNPLQDNKMVCHENSTNEDFDDETFSREGTIGLLSSSLI